MQAAIIPIIPVIQLRRLLFATDLSEPNCATRPIISTIARHYQSQVVIAHVCSPCAFPAVSEPNTRMMLEADQEDAANERMTDFLRRPELAGLQMEILIKRGMPTEQLGQIVKECSIDLVVVNTHGRSGIKRLLMGSVAEHLFRHLNCPVLTIGPRISERFCRQKQIETILYPTDLSDDPELCFLTWHHWLMNTEPGLRYCTFCPRRAATVVISDG